MQIWPPSTVTSRPDALPSILVSLPLLAYLGQIKPCNTGMFANFVPSQRSTLVNVLLSPIGLIGNLKNFRIRKLESNLKAGRLHLPKLNWGTYRHQPNNSRAVCDEMLHNAPRSVPTILAHGTLLGHRIGRRWV